MDKDAAKDIVSSEDKKKHEFSRLIAALGGEEVLEQIQKANVFISGLKGLGMEISKNLVLMGVAAMTIHDEEEVKIGDLSSNFYLTPNDIGKNRAEVVLPKLRELNERTNLVTFNGEVTEDVLKMHKIVILTNNRSMEEVLRVNDICHKHDLRFICSEVPGLFGYIFVDFGNSFETNDPTGEKEKTCFISHISRDKEGVVTTVEGKRHDLSSEDYVKITEVQGMTEVNGKEFEVKYLGPSQFSIGDTSQFSQYTKGGFITEVKKPKKVEFKPLREYIGSHLSASSCELSDWSKEARRFLYFLYIQALLKFRKDHSKNPRPGNQSDAEEVFENVKVLNSAIGEGKYSDEDLEKQKESVVRLAKGSCATLNPMAAIFGGIVAQEAIKAISHKFTPIKQFFFLDNIECLPANAEEPSEEDCAPQNSRYDDQIAVFGSKFNQKIRELKYFVVGAGAIGCEMLKNFAMMGVGSSGSGCVTVTDMDSIEVSNLNRQFLFRQWDIDEMKSECAAKAIKKMNPDINIKAMSTRVGDSTEEVFDDDFWLPLSGIANALDNIAARLYIDRRCVFYGKPLLESGTLGSKGNVQVVVPNITESYGSSTDPPEHETPICLLHSFPNNIEHCLQWARENAFEGHFIDEPTKVNQYLDKPNFVKTLSPNLRLSTLEILERSLVHREKSFDDCIVWAKKRFDHYYNHNHRQLLYTFPLDYVDSNGAPFWSGAKRPPKVITYDANDPLHLDFVVSATFLRAYTLGILSSEKKPLDLSDKVGYIKEVSSKVPMEEWKPKHGVKIETDEKVTKAQESSSVGDDDEERCEKILKELPKRENVSWRANEIEFEKDDDTNFHIDFINAASNLRAVAYGIPPVDRLKSKLIAGKIMPAMITTTALVTGMVCIELYKLFQEGKKIEDYRNAFVNLAIPLFQQSEPIPPVKEDFMGKEFTLWDRIDIKQGDITLGELLEYLQKEYKMEVEMLGVGPALIYSSFGKKGKERLPKKMSILVPEISKMELKPHQKYFQIEVTAVDPEGNDIENNPAIFFWLTK